MAAPIAAEAEAAAHTIGGAIGDYEIATKNQRPICRLSEANVFIESVTNARYRSAVKHFAKTATGSITTARVMKQWFFPMATRAEQEARHIEIEPPESPEQYNYRVTSGVLQ